MSPGTWVWAQGVKHEGLPWILFQVTTEGAGHDGSVKPFKDPGSHPQSLSFVELNSNLNSLLYYLFYLLYNLILLLKEDLYLIVHQ